MTNHEGRKKKQGEEERENYTISFSGCVLLERFIPFDPRRPTNSHTEGHWRDLDLLQ